MVMRKWRGILDDAKKLLRLAKTGFFSGLIFEGMDSELCPYCVEYEGCVGCPVSEKVDSRGCLNTPWHVYNRCVEIIDGVMGADTVIDISKIKLFEDLVEAVRAEYDFLATVED